MTNPAKLAIEEAYSLALNPDVDYLAQLQPLAPAGELANRLSSNQVLFKLCMIVDQQAKEIKALQDDRVAIARKMLELEAKKVDPTAPLG